MGLYVCEKVSIMGLILIIIVQLTPKNTKESITLEPCFIIKERYRKKITLKLANHQGMPLPLDNTAKSLILLGR